MFNKHQLQIIWLIVVAAAAASPKCACQMKIYGIKTQLSFVKHSSEVASSKLAAKEHWELISAKDYQEVQRERQLLDSTKGLVPTHTACVVCDLMLEICSNLLQICAKNQCKSIPLAQSRGRERERERWVSSEEDVYLGTSAPFFYFILEDRLLVGKTIILQTRQISSLQKNKKKRKGTACTDRKIF